MPSPIQTSAVIVTQGNILGTAGPAGPPGSSIQTIRRFTYQLASGNVGSISGPSSPTVVGASRWDISALFSSIPASLACYLRIAVNCTNSSNPIYFDLFDLNGLLTSGTPSQVSGTAFTTSSTTPVYNQYNLTSVFTSGGLLSLLSPTGIFQARLWMSPVSYGQQAVCTMAKIDFEWT